MLITLVVRFMCCKGRLMTTGLMRTGIPILGRLWKIYSLVT